MNLPEFAPSDGPALPLRELILGALAEAFITRMTDGAFCRDCMTGHGLCPDHQADLELAEQYSAAYNQVAISSTAWADLAVLLAAGAN